MIKRRHYSSRDWREVTPRGPFVHFTRHMPLVIFRPVSEVGRPPVNGVAPLPEAPTEPGWYVVKQPTARLPYWEYFSEKGLRSALADHDDSKVSFYPWTPLRCPGNKKA